MKKNNRPLKQKRQNRSINETRSLKLMQNPFSFSNSPVKKGPVSKILTKETDEYCDLSISYTSDFPEPIGTEVLMSNARNSLLDLRTEAQLYLDSTRRIATKRARDSIISQSDSIYRNSLTCTDPLALLISNMNDTMKEINNKLEVVDEKATKRDEEIKNLKNTILDLQFNLEELSSSKGQYFGCSSMCEVI